MLADIDKETVDYRDNYDGTRQEPTVLPAKLPNLLLNGQIGIAVGMATNIPPHNLSELVDATVAMIDKPDVTLDELLEHVKGPDFPTGGIIYGKESIRTAYATGRGGIVIRGIAEIVEAPKVVANRSSSPKSRIRSTKRAWSSRSPTWSKRRKSPESVTCETNPPAATSASSSTSKKTPIPRNY